MKCFYIIFFLCLGLGGAQALASEVISLQQFLQLMVKHDPKFQSILLERAKLKFSVALGMPADEFVFEIKNVYGVSLDGGDNTSVLSGSFGKSIASTGTKFSASYEENNGLDRIEASSELLLEQSLYNNSFGRDGRIKKKSLSKRNEVLRFQIVEAYEDYLLELSKMYLDFSQAHINVKLSKDIYHKYLELKKNVISKKKKNIASQADVDRVELQTLLRLEDLLKNQETLRSLSEQINAMTNNKKNMNFRPQQNVDYSIRYEKKIKNRKIALEDLRLMKMANVEQKVLADELSLAKNSLNPELDLLLGLTRDHSTRFGTRVDTQQGLVGLALNMPIGDSIGKAEVQEKLVQIKQVTLEKKMMLNDTKRKKIELSISIDKLKRNTEIHQSKIKLMKRILKDDERRYRFGTLLLEKVIESRNNLATYQYQLQSDLVELNKAVIEWLAFTDQLLEPKISQSLFNGY